MGYRVVLSPNARTLHKHNGTGSKLGSNQPDEKMVAHTIVLRVNQLLDLLRKPV